MKFIIMFDRIGRNHHVAPLAAEAEDASRLAEKIYYYARPHLRSNDVQIVVDLEGGEGHIFCGFNNGGAFTVSEVTQ